MKTAANPASTSMPIKKSARLRYLTGWQQLKKKKRKIKEQNKSEKNQKTKRLAKVLRKIKLILAN